MIIHCRSGVGDTMLTFTIDPDMPRNQLIVSSVVIYRSANSPHTMLGFFTRGASTRSWNQVLKDDAFNIAARLLACLVQDIEAAYDYRTKGL